MHRHQIKHSESRFAKVPRYKLRTACVQAVLLLEIAIHSSLHAASTGFKQTGAGPWDYNTAGNWVSGINGIWNNDLTLAAAQNVTFAADTTLTTGLTFNYGGNFALSLYSTNTTARTLTLGGDVSMNTGSAQTVTLGNSTSNLNVNLGGVTRTFSVGSGQTLLVQNTLSNGGITKNGAGNLVIRGAGNNFAGVITINAGTFEARNGALGTTAGNSLVTSDGTVTTGGRLVLTANGNTYTTSEPITIQGPGESGANVLAALVGQQGWVTNTGAITLDGTGTYRIQCSPGNIVNANFNIKGGIARSGANVGTLLFEADSVNTGATNNQLLINSTINNNGGPVTLTSTTAGPATANKAYGTLVLNTTGHSIGDFTINGTYVEPVTNATILKLGVSNPLNTNANLNVISGMIDLNGFIQAVSNLTVAASGAIQMAVNRANAASTNGYFTVSGTPSVSGGTLFVTNVGAPFQPNDVIKLFNKAVTGFTSVSLPSGYNWQNRVAVDGTIRVIPAGPQTLYVSPSGSDTNIGSINSPMQTLAAAITNLNPGDTLYLRAGTYRETLTAANSGTAVSPITIAAYSNEVVTLSGCDLVTNNWTLTSNGVYSAAVGWDLGEGYNQVFVDGALVHEAQYPNWTATNGLMMPATVAVTSSNNFTISSSTFTNLGDVSGASFVGGVDPNWAWQNGVISSNSGTILFINSNAISGGWWWPVTYAPKYGASQPGFGFVYGKLNLLNADNEWFLDSPTTNLYLRIIGGANPTGHTVELKRRKWCIDLNGQNYVIVRGIQTRAGAIQMDGVGDVLDSCDAQYLSHFLDFTSGGTSDGGRPEGGGVVISGSSNVVSVCAIHDTAGSGIIVSGAGNVITRSQIFNTDYAGIYAEAVYMSGSNQTVSYCTIHDSGRDLIYPAGTGHKIIYNNLYGCGWLTKDLGILYVNSNDALDAGGNKTRIAYNWIHDPRPTFLAKGIYLDASGPGCRNYQLDHNVCWGFTNNGGHCIIFNPTTTNEFVYHNTMFNGPPYNVGTYAGTPSGNLYFFYNAQNNLYLSNSSAIAANLMNAGANDFRLKSGSSAINPATTNYTVAWTTTNGTTGVPPGFSLNTWTNGWPFTYQEIAGYGVVLPGINDAYAGATPDNGAYEFNGPYWQPGTNGWAVNQPQIQTNGVSFNQNTAALQGILISAGMPSAAVWLCWGSTDGGTNVNTWINQTNLGVFTGSFVSITQQLANLTPGATLSFRFYATNANGVDWSDVLTTYVPQTFYVSPSGSDANPGTLAAPKKTLGAAVSILNPGDTLNLRSGIYRETLTIPLSGTPGLPITITAYSNEVAVISGADVLTNSWSVYSNQIYQTQMPWTMDDASHYWHMGAGGNQLFVDGSMMVEARWPNLPANRHPAQISRNDFARSVQGAIIATNGGNQTAQYVLPNVPDTNNVFVGAYINFFSGCMWTPQSGTVTGSSNGVVTFQTKSFPTLVSAGNPVAYPRSNDAFYVWGKLSLLDTNREWFRDTSTGSLYLWMPSGDNPTNHLVEAKRRDFAVDLSGQSYIILRNLRIFAAGILTDSNSSNIMVDGLNAQYVAHATYCQYWWNDPVSYSPTWTDPWDATNASGGIWFLGNNHVIQNSIIQYSAGLGVMLEGCNLVASNNYIADVGYVGLGAAIDMLGTNLTVTANRLYGTGDEWEVQLRSSTNVWVTYNDMSDSARQTIDNGTFYGGSGLQNVTVAYNFMHDNHGLVPADGYAGYYGNVGIYLQDALTNVLVHHNVTWNTQGAFNYLPGSASISNLTVINNTFVSDRVSASTNAGVANGPIVFQNNICTNFSGNAGGYQGRSNWVYTATNVVLNPGFVNAANLNFSLASNSPCISKGLVLSPYTDGYFGTAPDVGAYEYNGPYWQPGTNGWTINQPAIQNNGAVLSASNAVLQGTLISAGLPSANAQVFWGPSDGGNSVNTWASQTNLGAFTGSFISLTQPVSGLTPGTSLTFRFYATNASGVSWSAPLTLTVPTPSTPTNLLYNVNGSTLTLSWPPSYLGWILQAQTNALNLGLQTASNAWFDVPGTAAVYTTNLQIITTNPAVFFRLRHP
jgi:hypothetical protein